MEEGTSVHQEHQDDKIQDEASAPMTKPEEEEEATNGSVGGVTSSEGHISGTDEAPNAGRKTVVGRRKDGRNYVQKNSLTEAQLMAAREATRDNLKRKAKQELTEDDKKEDRRAANRLSAFQSRQRRKMIIEDLQKTVAEQSKHNSDQAKEIAELKRQLQAARQENDMMRHQLASAGQAAGFGGAQLFGGAAGQMPGVASNPLLQQLGQSQMTFQQNFQLQNAMLQNALLFSAQAQQARGNQMPNNGSGGTQQAAGAANGNNQGTIMAAPAATNGMVTPPGQQLPPSSEQATQPQPDGTAPQEPQQQQQHQQGAAPLSLNGVGTNGAVDAAAAAQQTGVAEGNAVEMQV